MRKKTKSYDLICLQTSINTYIWVDMYYWTYVAKSMLINTHIHAYTCYLNVNFQENNQMLLWAYQKLYKDVPALASSPRAKEVYNTSNDTYSVPVPFLGRN